MSLSPSLRALLPSRTQWIVGISAALLALAVAYLILDWGRLHRLPFEEHLQAEHTDVPAEKPALSPEQIAKLRQDLSSLQAQGDAAVQRHKHLQDTLRNTPPQDPQAAQLKSELVANQSELARLSQECAAVSEKLGEGPIVAMAAAPEGLPFNLVYAAWLLGVVVGIALLIAIGTLFIYLGSPDRVRAERAGKVFKTAFTFVVTTATGAAAYMGFGLKG